MGPDDQLDLIVAGCTAAHRRLEATVASVDDDAVSRPSRLPGWTVGHVVAHLARNAESHLRMLAAAADGRSVEQYPGGANQRSADIEAGAARPAGVAGADLLACDAALEAAWAAMAPAAWAGHGLARGTEWPCRAMPFHRWREVELHHVDLGLGYSPSDWPAAYVDRELPLALATLPERVRAGDRAAVLAWLVDRAGPPPDVALDGWQTRPLDYHTGPPGLYP